MKNITVNFLSWFGFEYKNKTLLKFIDDFCHENRHKKVIKPIPCNLLLRILRYNYVLDIHLLFF